MGNDSLPHSSFDGAGKGGVAFGVSRVSSPLFCSLRRVADLHSFLAPSIWTKYTLAGELISPSPTSLVLANLSSVLSSSKPSPDPSSSPWPSSLSMLSSLLSVDGRRSTEESYPGYGETQSSTSASSCSPSFASSEITFGSSAFISPSSTRLPSYLVRY